MCHTLFLALNMTRFDLSFSVYVYLHKWFNKPNFHRTQDKLFLWWLIKSFVGVKIFFKSWFFSRLLGLSLKIKAHKIMTINIVTSPTFIAFFHRKVMMNFFVQLFWVSLTFHSFWTIIESQLNIYWNVLCHHEV